MIENAKWIKGGNLFRKDFEVDSIVQNAKLSVTGLGYYVAYINGERVGNIEAAPSYTAYNKRVEYNVFNVASMLRKGKNTIGVMLGSHWEKELTKEELQFKPYYKGENKMICSLDFNEQSIVSDNTFKCSYSPILNSSIYNGECFDARLIQQDWSNSNFNDKDWTFCAIERCDSTLCESKIPPVKIENVLNPIKKVINGNKLFLDFGENIAGKLLISGEFKPNLKIVMRHAENEFSDNTLNTGSLRIAKATDTYYTNGIGRETYSPFFTYHGFRFAEIECSDEKALRQLSVVALDVHTSVKSIATFECGNERLNKIYKMMQRTFLNNLYSIPTDCHQRDERQGWLADAQLSCESNIYSFDMHEFYLKYLDDISDTIESNGDLFAFTAPLAFAGESLMWQGAYYMIVFYLYKYYNDYDVVKKHYSKLLAYYKIIEAKEKNGFPVLSGLGDWLGVVPTKEEHISGATYIDYTCKMSEFAKLLNNNTDVAYFNEKALTLKKLYNEKFYSCHESTNKNSGYYGSCNDISQLSNALPICFDIVDKKDYNRVVEKLVYDLTIARGKTTITTGLIGTKYLFDALVKINRNDIALALLLNNEYPSWGFMLNHNATTVWERWEYMTDNEMNSHCHTPLAAPCKWLMTNLLGINYPTKENNKVIVELTPFLNDEVGFVKGSLNTSYGAVTMQWRSLENSYEVNFDLPTGMSAKFNNKEYSDKTNKIIINK